MKLKILPAAAMVLGAMAMQAQAQPTAAPAATPQTQRIEVPSSGLTFTFGEIDRNGDNSISVEEWNAFVASLRARTAAARPESGASAGATRSPDARPLPR